VWLTSDLCLMTLWIEHQFINDFTDSVWCRKRHQIQGKIYCYYFWNLMWYPVLIARLHSFKHIILIWQFSPSVHPSLLLSHSRIVSKQLNISRKFFVRLPHNFVNYQLLWNLNEVIPKGVLKYRRRGMKISWFLANKFLYLVYIGRVTVEDCWESYVLYCTTWSSMTSCDLPRLFHLLLAFQNTPVLWQYNYTYDIFRYHVAASSQFSSQ